MHVAVSQNLLDRSSTIGLDDIVTVLEPGNKRLVEQVLHSQQIDGLLGVWLDAGGPTQGFLTLLSDTLTFGTTTVNGCSRSLPHLGNLLNHHLPRHVKVAAEPLLTPREAETVDLVAAGYSGTAPSPVAWTSPESTVKKHVSAALAELDRHEPHAAHARLARGRGEQARQGVAAALSVSDVQGSRTERSASLTRDHLRLGDPRVETGARPSVPPRPHRRETLPRDGRRRSR